MSENESDNASDLKYTATFIRGNFHALRDLTWDVPGRCIIISEAQMLHLEEHAVDHVGTSDGETLTKERFEFEPYDGPEPVGYRFPTEEETAKAETIAASLARGRRHAAAKATVDAEMEDFDKSYVPTPRARARTRQ